jgi:hypothetical protein
MFSFQWAILFSLPTGNLIRNYIHIAFKYGIGLDLRKTESLGHTGEVELLGDVGHGHAEPSGLIGRLAGLGSRANGCPGRDEGLSDVNGKSNCSTGVFQTVNVSFPKLLL